MIVSKKTAHVMFSIVLWDLYLLSAYAAGNQTGNQTSESNSNGWNIFADPIVITAIFSAISGLAALGATIILYFTYKKQYKLVNLQTQELEQKLKSQLQQHYDIIKDRIKNIIDFNKGTIYQAKKSELPDWSSMEIPFPALRIINNDENINVKRHILKKISNLDAILQGIEEKRSGYNLAVSELKVKLTNKIIDKYSTFDLVRTVDTPSIMTEIEKYWLSDIVTKNLETGSDINKIISQVEPIDQRYSIKSGTKDEENPGIWFGSNQKAYPPAEKDKFVKITMDLITDKSIIDEIKKLVLSRDDIVILVESLNIQLCDIAKAITDKKYHEKLECC